MKALIPTSAEHLGGPFLEAEDGFRIVGQHDRQMLVEFNELPVEITWFKEFEVMFCQRMNTGNAFKVIRLATDDELKKFRVPVWIQDEEIPECCGRPMFFVGQIDDDGIATERPQGAKLWWHDAASFYVFTCPQCLECQAVGQQF